MPVMKRVRTDLVSQTQGRIKGRIFFPHAAFQLPELMDMRIVVCPVEGAKPEGEPLPFNSSLLAASSPVFRQRMRRGAVGVDSGFFFRPYEERVLTITHADREHVEMMLKFFQGWDVRFGLADAAEVWQLGNFYEVPDMCEAALRLWFDVLDPSNCCQLLTFALTYDIKKLTDRCFDLLILRFDAVALKSGEHFQALSAEVIDYVAGMDSLVVDSEYQLLHHIFTWFMHDPSRRRDALVQMLKDRIREDRLLSEDCEPTFGDWYFVSINATQKERRVAVLLNRMRAWIICGAYGIKHDTTGDPQGILYDPSAESLPREEWIARRAEAREVADTVEELMRSLLLAAPYAVDHNLNLRHASVLKSSPRQYYWGRLYMQNAPGATGQNAPFPPGGKTIGLGGSDVCTIGRNHLSTVLLKMNVVSSRHAQVSARVEWRQGIGLTCKADRADSKATLIPYLTDSSSNGTWINGVKLYKGMTVPILCGARIGLCAPFATHEQAAQASHNGATLPPRMRFLAPLKGMLNPDGTDPDAMSISSEEMSPSEDEDEGEGESQEF